MPCMAAMMPRRPKRGISSRLRCWACSVLQRGLVLSGGGEEPGAVGAQRAVDEAFDGPDRQVVVDGSDHPVVRAALGKGPVPRAEHDVEADRQGPLLGHLL